MSIRRVECVVPHTGQVAIANVDSRHRVVRCGRRFGKSTLGEVETLGTYEIPGVLTRNKYHVGWFTPEYKYLDVIWRDIVRMCKPLEKNCDNSKHRLELINGSTVEAWSLLNNPDAGRSRKYHKIVVDEAGLVPNLRRWWDSSALATLIDYQGRALLLGTPHPIGPDFDQFFDDAATDDEWAAISATTFDNSYLPIEELEKIRKRRSKMPDWLWLQEFMAIPCDAAAGFFPRSLIKRLRDLAIDPVFQGDLTLGDVGSAALDYALENREGRRATWAEIPERGVWKLWFHPDEVDSMREYGFVMGADIGAGVGSSNTTFTVFCPDLGKKVAEYASPLVGPENAARVAATFGLWLGGRFGSVRICPETNGGSGQAFIKGLMQIQYPTIFSMREGGPRRDARQIRKTTEMGWNSTTRGKEALLIAYQTALGNGTFVNPSDIALAECLTYSYDKAGSLVSVRRDDDPTVDVARIPHGDRVIADALAWHAAIHAPPGEEPQQVPPDPTSFQARKAERIRKLKKASKGGYGF